MTHAPNPGDAGEDDGPLHGLRVVELAGIGPGPYAAMLLADMGAEVVRIERPGPAASSLPVAVDVLRRGRESVVVDTRQDDGVRAVLGLVTGADVLLEGYRPGVTERMGLGPEDCWAVNPRLVYGRMTGWGQEGPLSHSAGHDIGYIALTGALHAIGPADGGPVPPLNLVGDFGGGSLFLVAGVLAAVWEAGRSGRGQVVDAAIVDGAASLTGMMHSMLAAGLWRDERGANMLDGGQPWYATYATSDNRWMAVGALEPKFYAELMGRLGLEADEAERADRSRWPALRARIAGAFASRTQEEWRAEFDGTDSCVAPVLPFAEAPQDPHLVARGTFVDVAGVAQPAPAPRFTRSGSRTPRAPEPAMSAERAVHLLTRWGVESAADLVAGGAVQGAASSAVP
ncbi:CoA transferase [Actinomycetospora sp. TBRC 11914]|nr:CoA transferase [Actinomycetospora sp. TBRC 11914]